MAETSTDFTSDANTNIKNMFLLRIAALKPDEALNISKLTSTGRGARKTKMPKSLVNYYVLSLPRSIESLQMSTSSRSAENSVISNNLNAIRTFAGFFNPEQLTLAREPTSLSKEKIKVRLSSLTEGEYLDVSKLRETAAGSRKRQLPVNLDGWSILQDYPVISKGKKGLQMFAQIMGLNDLLQSEVIPQVQRRVTNKRLLERMMEAQEKGKILDVSNITNTGTGARVKAVPSSLSAKKQILDLPAYSDSKAATQIFLLLLEKEDPAHSLLPESSKSMTYIQYYKNASGTTSRQTIAELLASDKTILLLR